VRSASCFVIPKLLDCVVQHIVKRGANPAMMTELWMKVFPSLLESINAEPDVRVLCDKVRDYGQVVKEPIRRLSFLIVSDLFFFLI
jgi:hypothetical protein